MCLLSSWTTVYVQADKLSDSISHTLGFGLVADPELETHVQLDLPKSFAQIVSLPLETMGQSKSSPALACNSLILQAGQHSVEMLSQMSAQPFLGVQPSFQMRAGSA